MARQPHPPLHGTRPHRNHPRSQPIPDVHRSRRRSSAHPRRHQGVAGMGNHHRRRQHMSVLQFSGVITRGDSCRVSDDEPEGDILIGGVDFLAAVDNAFKSGQSITVGILDDAVETVAGSLAVDLGWGYSDYTPMDEDSLTVGGSDVLKALARRENQQVTVVVSDGPIDLSSLLGDNT